MKTYTIFLKCLPFSRRVLQLIFQRYPNYRLYSLYYKYKSGKTLNGRYFVYDAGRDSIFLHELDKCLKDSHNKFQLSTTFECRLMAYFRRKYIKTVQLCSKSALKMIQNCTKKFIERSKLFCTSF